MSGSAAPHVPAKQELRAKLRVGSDEYLLADFTTIDAPVVVERPLVGRARAEILWVGGRLRLTQSFYLPPGAEVTLLLPWEGIAREVRVKLPCGLAGRRCQVPYEVLT